jgi:hypothetical protein
MKENEVMTTTDLKIKTVTSLNVKNSRYRRKAVLSGAVIEKNI